MRQVQHVLLGIMISFSMFGNVNAQVQSDLLARINNLRSSLGLAPYNLNNALSAAAKNHARWMIESGQVSHTQPNGSNPRSRAAAAGYNSQWVSENIYGGTGATTDVAWNFWVNSGVHYRGLTNPNYRDVGIGSATGDWGTAYVLVFGTLNAEWQSPQTLNGTNDNSSGNNVEVNMPPPSFVVGVDAYGNIMHEIQPGDTAGDIALLYGYSWDEIPYMMQLNELNDITVRELKVGSVFLIPPSGGTYTPTPQPRTDTPTPTDTSEPTLTSTVTATPPEPTRTPRMLPATADMLLAIPTATPEPTDTLTPLVVAEAVNAPEEGPQSVTEQRITASNGRSPWLYVAIGVQVLLIVGAGVELVLRQLRR